MPDPAVLAVAAAALASLALAAAWACLRRVAPPPPVVRWELRFPRDTGFPVPQAAEWFAALTARITAATQFSVEIRGTAGRARLAVEAPAALEPFLRAQLAARFPEARLEPLVETDGTAAWVPVALEKPDVLPVRVPSAGDPDPLPGFAAVLCEGAPAGLRVALGPPPADWKRWAPAALEALRHGSAPPGRGIIFRLQSLGSRLGDGAQPDGGRPAPLGDGAKAAAPVYSARIAAWASGTGPDALARTRQVAAGLRAAYADLAGNAFVPGREPSITSLPDALRRAPAVTLSAAELASLFHVPDGGHPLLAAEPSRLVHPAPRSLDRAEGHEPDTLLGEALTAEGPVPFGLAPEERRRHLYVVGKTGTGKSTLLANVVRQDLEAGRGLALVDPHGDLAELALSLVPPRRIGEVAYLDPADRDWPVGLNLLHAASPGERPLVASGVVGAFKKLWGDSWGPRLEHYLRNSLLLLLEDDEPSLAALPRLLSDRGYRARLLSRASDPLLRGFFLDEFEKADPAWRAAAVAPIQNKVGQFLASPLVRHVVGQKGPGLPLSRVMDEGLVLVANLSAGRIGEDGSALIGGLLVAGLQLAAMRRAERPEEGRRDFFLAVDEFQRFDNEAFAQILAESRKYRLSLVLSHQYLAQVSPETLAAVLGNAGSLAAFRVGAPDAARLARELAPEFQEQDLTTLPDFRFAARVHRPGATVPAFSARSLPPPHAAGDVVTVVDSSRKRWARPAAEVETEIADLWEGRDA